MLWTSSCQFVMIKHRIILSSGLSLIIKCVQNRDTRAAYFHESSYACVCDMCTGTQWTLTANLRAKSVLACCVTQIAMGQDLPIAIDHFYGAQFVLNLAQKTFENGNRPSDHWEHLIHSASAYTENDRVELTWIFILDGENRRIFHFASLQCLCCIGEWSISRLFSSSNISIFKKAETLRKWK